MIRDSQTDRREFLKAISLAGGSLLLSGPLAWIRTYAAESAPSVRKARLGMIGIGSRGSLLFLHLKDIPEAEIVALCDNYPPHLKRALAWMENKARGYEDYREMLEKEELDGVVIATPLHTHARIAIDALHAGKQVFCEKSMAKTPEDCLSMVKAQQETGNLLLIGHQRMFSPLYLKMFELIRRGQIGEVTQIRAYWHRNNDWRRPVPEPGLERKINWRLYREYSRGLMTELASHQLQVANVVLKSYPVKVSGAGSINFWKDGREVFDNVNLVYTYPGGVQVIYDSLTSNKHYGLEEQIMGPKGTFEPEAGKLFSENPPPAPGILQLINDIEHALFDPLPLGGASWVPETAATDQGWNILDKKPEDDGTRLEMESFVRAVINGEKYPDLLREAYYASVAAILGDESMLQGKTLDMPESLIL